MSCPKIRSYPLDQKFKFKFKFSKIFRMLVDNLKTLSASASNNTERINSDFSNNKHFENVQTNFSNYSVSLSHHFLFRTMNNKRFPFSCSSNAQRERRKRNVIAYASSWHIPIERVRCFRKWIAWWRNVSTGEC